MELQLRLQLRFLIGDSQRASQLQTFAVLGFIEILDIILFVRMADGERKVSTGLNSLREWHNLCIVLQDIYYVVNCNVLLEAIQS